MGISRTWGRSTEAGRLEIAADEEIVLDIPRAPWPLFVSPAEGATVTIEITGTPTRVLRDTPESAIWHALGEPITAAQAIAYPAPVTAVRISTADAGATVDVVS
jgi:hypothetical protein